MSTNDNLAQLAAAFNDHQVTDENGELNQGETDTPVDDTATNEQTAEESTGKPESVDEPKSEPKTEEEHQDEAEVAEDESGQKYIPKKRFDKMYGRMKEYERKLQEKEKMVEQGKKFLEQPEATPSAPAKPLPKAEMLEIEMLRMQMPEFDPSSGQYSQELDALGGEIFRANPGITRLEAARRARTYAESITKRQVEAKEEARAYKAQNSDSGITNRVVSRVVAKKPEEMSLEEMEAHLKATNQW